MAPPARATCLELEELRFHDLRHECTSRLSEQACQIHEIALITLHRSRAELPRHEAPGGARAMHARGSGYYT